MADIITGVVGSKLIQLKNVQTKQIIAQAVVANEENEERVMASYEALKEGRADKADLAVLILQKV